MDESAKPEDTLRYLVEPLRSLFVLVNLDVHLDLDGPENLTPQPDSTQVKQYT